MAKKKDSTINLTDHFGGVDVIGKIGTDGGYAVKDCPALIPQENMKMFSAMTKACKEKKFPGVYNPFDNWNN